MKRKNLVETYSGYSTKDLNKYGIYRIWFTNDPKNRSYIGSALNQGSKKAKRKGFGSRWTGHISTLLSKNNKCPKLQNACNKYGIENIKFEILCELKIGYAFIYYELIETGYIYKYNSVNNGLNSTYNGKNRKGIPCSESIKKAISKANSGSKNGMFGKCLGKHHNSKIIYQYAPSGKFLKSWSCAREIQNVIGISYKDISSVCLGKIRVIGGCKWFYEYKGDIIEPFFIKPRSNTKLAFSVPEEGKYGEFNFAI
jgi:hypothetical protein